jgi:DNA-binding response OmpR family regulator
MATILVIEDEKLLREDIGEVLMLEDFDVMEAADGRVGIQIAMERRPDLILCDISMPEADGYEVLTALRNHSTTAEIPFIFLTARVDTEFVRKAEGLGVDEYMTKPFSNSELMATIRSFLWRREKIASFRAETLENLTQQVAQLVEHELRAYSFSVAAAAGLIARQLQEADSTRLLARVNAGGYYLDYLAKQLGNLIRVELGLVSTEKIQNKGMIVEVWPLLSSAISQAKQLAHCHHIDAVRMRGAEDRIYIQCDSRALRQALADPIAQALNASLPDRMVQISLGVLDQQVSIVIAFEDSGRTEPDVPELLFGPADTLRLSGQIIQLHGGLLKVGNDRHVEISLPLVTLNLRYG